MKIREMRREAGLTQVQLAARADVHPLTVTRWENGAITPPLSTLKRLAGIFGCRLTDLVDEGVA